MMSHHDTEKQIEKPEAGLYLVATPIGNLRDITLRALAVLRGVDVILCEDTRVTRKLLSAYGISAKTRTYNDHSDAQVRDDVIGMIAGGQAVALVSDAGMPMISDPGYKLVQACHGAGVSVTSLPGANAPLAALQLSGFPSDCFTFIGFLPNKTKARKDVLARWSDAQTTLIAFESAPRLIDCLSDIHAVMGARDVAVVREITKMFEEVRKGDAQDLVAHYTEKGAPKGEIVLVIAPPQVKETSAHDLEHLLRNALQTMKTKEAAASVAQKTGANKKDLYDMALRIARQPQDDF